MQHADVWLAPLALLPVVALLILSTVHRFASERGTLEQPDIKTSVRILRLILALLYLSFITLMMALLLTGLFKTYYKELLYIVPSFTFAGIILLIIAGFFLIIEILFIRR